MKSQKTCVVGKESKSPMNVPASWYRYSPEAAWTDFLLATSSEGVLGFSIGFFLARVARLVRHHTVAPV